MEEQEEEGEEVVEVAGEQQWGQAVEWSLQSSPSDCCCETHTEIVSQKKIPG